MQTNTYEIHACIPYVYFDIEISKPVIEYETFEGETHYSESYDLLKAELWMSRFPASIGNINAEINESEAIEAQLKDRKNLNIRFQVESKLDDDDDFCDYIDSSLPDDWHIDEICKV